MILYKDNKIANRVEIDNAVLADEFMNSETYNGNYGHMPSQRVFNLWLCREKQATSDWEGEGLNQAIKDMDSILIIVSNKNYRKFNVTA